MRGIWEASDIRPGRRFSKPGLTEIRMIGLAPAGVNNYTWISLTDGMVAEAKTKESLAELLNSAGYQPLEPLERSNATS